MMGGSRPESDWGAWHSGHRHTGTGHWLAQDTVDMAGDSEHNLWKRHDFLPQQFTITDIFPDTPREGSINRKNRPIYW